MYWTIRTARNNLDFQRSKRMNLQDCRRFFFKELMLLSYRLAQVDQFISNSPLPLRRYHSRPIELNEPPIWAWIITRAWFFSDLILTDFNNYEKHGGQLGERIFFPYADRRWTSTSAGYVFFPRPVYVAGEIRMCVATRTGRATQHHWPTTCTRTVCTSTAHRTRTWNTSKCMHGGGIQVRP
jgi:hypothetical protein